MAHKFHSMAHKSPGQRPKSLESFKASGYCSNIDIGDQARASEA